MNFETEAFDSKSRVCYTEVTSAEIRGKYNEL